MASSFGKLPTTSVTSVSKVGDVSTREKRLQDGEGESLGGEFWLVDENVVGSAWGAGLNAADKNRK